ncbi:MAG: succinate dehydrogenase assembly factor 2 [Pseudomonadota bacterium]|nr:succinate dehydrogenase assembly factor 2 [Pseudomonadota bacterium]
MSKNLNQQRKRILFRAHRRGTKESDMVIGGFAKAYVEDLTAAQLDRFEALLERNDPDVLGWVIGIATPPEEFDTDVLDMIKNFKYEL